MAKRIWGLLALLASTACGESTAEKGDDFAYSEQQLRAAVVGDWTGDGRLEDVDGEGDPLGDFVHFSLTLEQPSGAEIETSNGSRVMPITARLSCDDADVLTTSASGTVTAYGQLDSKYIDLELENGLELFGPIEYNVMSVYLAGPRAFGRLVIGRKR